MPIKGITVSGHFRSSHDKPIKNAEVKVYQLDGLFKALVLDTFATDENGYYHFKFYYEGGRASILLMAPGKAPLEPLFSKLITISDQTKQIEIPSPPLQQRKRKLNSTRPSTLRRRSKSFSVKKISVEDESESSTISSHQEIFHPLASPLSNHELHQFFFRSFYCHPVAFGEQSEKLHVDSSELKLAKFFRSNFPEAQFHLKNKSPYEISEIHLHRPGSDWITYERDDPDFPLGFSQALNTFLQEGLVNKLIPWCHVLPGLYAQAFISTISENNPLRKLLSAFLSEELLIEKHIGLTRKHPLLQMRRKLGIDRHEGLKHIHEGLKEHPFARTDHQKGTFKDPLIKVIRSQVIEPAVSYFFDSYREMLVEDYWEEIYFLSQTFASLHPLNSDRSIGWWKPFIKSSLKMQQGEMKLLQEWSINALLVAILMPLFMRKNLKYFTNPLLSPLPPQMITELESWLQIRKTKVLELPDLYPPLKANFVNASEGLHKHGHDIDELTV